MTWHLVIAVTSLVPHLGPAFLSEVDTDCLRQASQSEVRRQWEQPSGSRGSCTGHADEPPENYLLLPPPRQESTRDAGDDQNVWRAFETRMHNESDRSCQAHSTSRVGRQGSSSNRNMHSHRSARRSTTPNLRHDRTRDQARDDDEDSDTVYCTMEVNAETEPLSRALTKWLRHIAKIKGMQMTPDGFVRMSELLGRNTFRELDATPQKLKDAVDNDPKRRFEMTVRNACSLIRAVQGHSIVELRDDWMFERLTKDTLDLPSAVYHGTQHRCMGSITFEGFKTMGRNHVHLVASVPNGREIPGLSNSADWVLIVNLLQSLMDGMVWRSSNNVILTRGFDDIIPFRYLVAKTPLVFDNRGRRTLGRRTALYFRVIRPQVPPLTAHPHTESAGVSVAALPMTATKPTCSSLQDIVDTVDEDNAGDCGFKRLVEGAWSEHNGQRIEVRNPPGPRPVKERSVKCQTDVPVRTLRLVPVSSGLFSKGQRNMGVKTWSGLVSAFVQLTLEQQRSCVDENTKWRLMHDEEDTAGKAAHFLEHVNLVNHSVTGTRRLISGEVEVVRVCDAPYVMVDPMGLDFLKRRGLQRAGVAAGAIYEVIGLKARGCFSLELQRAIWREELEHYLWSYRASRTFSLR